MDDSDRPRFGLALTAAALAWTLCAAPAVAQRAASRAEVVLDAASSVLDPGSRQFVFRDVTIAQGDTRVTADEARASGTDFENALWVFTGRVRMSVQGGALRADRARVQFRDNVIVSARVDGAPAEFEQRQRNRSEIARGRATTMQYDAASGTIRLSESAWLSDGRNDISGNELIYNLKDQKVEAQSKPGADQRVRITIRPAARSTP
ncbi:MAG: lipopolysaccharide transport periplasmic protein LptA [Steroidobacteraceae bacterium]|nr:lipopolysaccharide transport periplasmic protein LptA [Steroidobacteraceae bacterium]MDW8257909.1 lipopolysaccharide transport periplasmic protein LptA [Gammaproteobacteria bacterium]